MKLTTVPILVKPCLRCLAAFRDLSRDWLVVWDDLAVFVTNHEVPIRMRAYGDLTEAFRHVGAGGLSDLQPTGADGIAAIVVGFSLAWKVHIASPPVGRFCFRLGWRQWVGRLELTHRFHPG